MADVRDYLEMRGDITLAERPFNDVDNVILASLSYLDFKDIVPAPEEGGFIRMADACHAFLNRAELQARENATAKSIAGTSNKTAELDIAEWVLSLATIDERFVKALGSSERFTNAVLRSYVDIVDDEKPVQFSALCIDLNEEETYVSYRGTDNTLTGWREDFMLSFTVTEAQSMAANYLADEAVRAQTEGRRLYIGGHSKGGILAAYAALSLPEEYRDLVCKVWSNDGPGMEPSILPAGTRCHSIYGERYVHVVPEYSVIGMLMDDGCAKTVVKSNAAAALQHDPMSWQVKPLELDIAPDLLPECKRMNQALANWIQSMPVNERKDFTNELFDVLEAGGATTLDEVVESPSAIYKVLAALAGASQQTHQIVYDLFGEAISAGVDTMGDALGDYVDSAKDAMRNAASKAAASVVEQVRGLNATSCEDSPSC